MPLPGSQKLACVFTATPATVVEDNDSRTFLQVITAVGPKIGAFSFPAAGIELGHGRLIDMERAAFQQQFNQPIHQGLQRHPRTPYPFRQGRAGQNDLVTGGDLLQPVEREMIQVFTDQYPRQQAHGGHATIDDGGRNRRGGDGFTVTASILRTDVAVDKELGGFDIELFSDVFANFNQVLAALTTLAGLRLVAVFTTRQMRWQGLTTRAGTLGFGNGGTGLVTGLLDFVRQVKLVIFLQGESPCLEFKGMNS